MTVTQQRLPSGHRLIVVDNVYRRPNEVRATALSAMYETESSGRYPGRNSLARTIDKNLVELFGGLVGAKIRIGPQDAFGVFRISRKADPLRNFIHADPVKWGAVIYLNPDPPPESGTAFWKHGALGLNEHPFKTWHGLGFESEASAFEKLIKQDGADETLWEQVGFVSGAFNRLALFESRAYHSHMPKMNFGHWDHDARLAQVFFFETE